MGTHPIFESDFDCLTDGIESFSAGGRRVYDSENSSFALSSLESAPKWAIFVRV